jgi:hypothetical protein
VSAPAGRSWWQRIDPGLRWAVLEAVALWITLRVGLSLVALFVAVDFDPPGPCHYEQAFNGWRTMPDLVDQPLSFPLLGMWQRWDACWYLKIATFGYEVDERSVAFYPLFPLATRLMSIFTGGHLMLAGMIVSAIAYVAAMTGLLLLVGQDFGRSVARRAARFLSVFPAAFFLFAPFTEALYLALVTWTLLAARRRLWWAVALGGALCALTRGQGVLMVAPLAWEAWLVWSGRPRGEEGEGDDGPSRPTDWGERMTSLLAAASPVVGLAIFAGVARALVGETPFDAQDVWGGREFHAPWDVIGASAGWIVEHGDAMQAVNLLTLLGATALLAAGVTRLPVTYLLFGATHLLIIATRLQPTPLTSTTRFVLAIFPVFVVMALLARGPRARFAVAVISTLGLAVLAIRFLTGDFVA